MNGATPPSKEPFYVPILALYSHVKPWRHNFETKKGVYLSYTPTGRALYIPRNSYRGFRSRAIIAVTLSLAAFAFLGTPPATASTNAPLGKPITLLIGSKVPNDTDRPCISEEPLTGRAVIIRCDGHLGYRFTHPLEDSPLYNPFLNKCLGVVATGANTYSVFFVTGSDHCQRFSFIPASGPLLAPGGPHPVQIKAKSGPNLCLRIDRPGVGANVIARTCVSPPVVGVPGEPFGRASQFWYFGTS
jgi:hypothetical protein